MFLLNDLWISQERVDILFIYLGIVSIGISMISHVEDELQANTLLLDRYEVVGLIGQGGMASVYKVIDLESHKILALKVLKYKEDQTFIEIERFRKEFSAMSNMSHPSIVSAYSFIEEEAFTAITMELINGMDLDQIIHGEMVSMSMDDRIMVLEQVAEGLLYAHERGLIHRDLKPSNILVVRPETEEDKLLAKISDFGLTQFDSDGVDLSKSSNQVGTFYYMAPEQHRGEAISFHSDIYSFGILAFELFTGEKPFEGSTPYSLFLAHVSKGLPEPRSINPEIPKWVSTLIEICAEKDKKHRYQSMQEVLSYMRLQKDKKKSSFISRLLVRS